ncbi:MAG: ubiquinone/menaquinone biosynthesis methyltransferase [Pseudomonadota bacterium]
MPVPNATAARPEEIRRMFAAVSRRYDAFNSINSFGIHRRWRRALVRYSGARPGDRILDCATGTGDLAFAFERELGPQSRIIGVDFCGEMLGVAGRKARKRASHVRFERADVLNLPFRTASFDAAAIAFGIRNIPDITGAIREMARVVRSGGRVTVLEFGRPGNRCLALAVSAYFRWFVSGISGVFTGNRRAYRYLETSTARFDTGRELVEACRASDAFREVEIRPLTLGMVYLYRLTVR